MISAVFALQNESENCGRLQCTAYVYQNVEYYVQKEMLLFSQTVNDGADCIKHTAEKY